MTENKHQEEELCLFWLFKNCSHNTIKKDISRLHLKCLEGMMEATNDKLLAINNKGKEHETDHIADMITDVQMNNTQKQRFSVTEGQKDIRNNKTLFVICHRVLCPTSLYNLKQDNYIWDVLLNNDIFVSLNRMKENIVNVIRLGFLFGINMKHSPPAVVKQMLNDEFETAGIPNPNFMVKTQHICMGTEPISPSRKTMAYKIQCNQKDSQDLTWCFEQIRRRPMFMNYGEKSWSQTFSLELWGNKTSRLRRHGWSKSTASQNQQCNNFEPILNQLRVLWTYSPP